MVGLEIDGVTKAYPFVELKNAVTPGRPREWSASERAYQRRIVQCLGSRRKWEADPLRNGLLVRLVSLPSEHTGVHSALRRRASLEAVSETHI